MGAWLYEGLLALAVAFFVNLFIVGALMGLLQKWTGSAHPATQAILFVVLGLYFSWFWSRGQTLAMKTWHIRVVTRAGQPLSQSHALLRYALCWVWVLPPLAAASVFKLPLTPLIAVTLGWAALWALASRLHPQRQFWHDALAGTRLIDTRLGVER
jgi:uncharacterized RDD family membrane protein YckC